MPARIEGFVFFMCAGILHYMTTEEIQKLALLARIDITESEAAGFQKDFEVILGYVDQISSVDVDTDDSRQELVNVMREDVEPYEPGQFTEDILANAPSVQDGFIKVQKIL